VKRSPLPRGTKRISRGTPLISGGALKPGTKGLKRSELVARKPKRSSEERRARALVWERASARCERCGRAPATNWHHRRKRSAGGLWTPENGMALCGTGTTGCHGEVTVNPRISYQQGWSVRSTQDPALAPVWIAGQGFVYLTAAGTYRPVETSAA
jgi:hypothetical protein